MYKLMVYDNYWKIGYDKEPFLYVRVSSDGRQEWLKGLFYHRINGPACIRDGAKYWYINGRLHRDNGPAVVYDSGAKYWYVNGQEIYNTWE